MKHLRQYIRNILNEAMLKANQLPEDVTVVIQDIDGDSSQFSIYYKTARFSFPLGEIRIGRQENCDGAMKVIDVYSELENGGPLLYDLAIEVATIHANGLTPDRGYVSWSARQVWDYYYNNRSDVKSIPLSPELCPAIYHIVDWQASPMSKRYTKSPTTIKQLRSMKKLEML
jgi:hypothetical protein